MALPACGGAFTTPSAVAPEAACRTADTSVAVRWVASPDRGDRAALDRWCAGVGPVVAMSAVAREWRESGDTVSSHGPNVVVDPASSLVVMTWNTHVGGGDIAGMVRDLRAGDFTDGTPVRHFVLLLQETHRASVSVPTSPGAAVPKPIHTSHGSRRVDIVETARELGLDLFYVPSMGNGRPARGLPEDRGNAILSSLPLRDLTAIELPYEAQRRVAAAATVSGTTAAGAPWSLRLVNVHLDNRSRASRLLQSLGGARTRQARALVKALGDDSAVVVGGDMNTWSLGFMEGAVEVLQQHFPLPTQHPREPTFASGGLRLDRLMYRLPATSAADTRRLADRRGSDHHPLIGTIHFAGDARLAVTSDDQR